MKRIVWGLQAAVVLLLSLPLAVLPVGFGEFLGLLLYYAWRGKRAIAIDNLRRCVEIGTVNLASSPEEAIRENFLNLGRSFMEIVKIYHGVGRGILRKVTIKGIENFEKAKARGKGVIFVTGHCGNWELMAVAFSFRMAPLAVVARPLNNPYLNRIIERARSRYGNTSIYKKGALKTVLSALRKGGYVGVLMDQAVFPEEGYVMGFLGMDAWTSKMPALIARKTGAPVLPAFIRRTDEGHEITVRPEVSLSSCTSQDEAVKEDTERFSSFIEEYIRENPSQWLWMHRRWKRASVKAGGSLEGTVAGERT